MEVDINQKRLSIRSEYSIYINQKERYSAIKKVFRFLGKINLNDISEGRSRYLMQQNWAWLNLSYNLYRYDNAKLELRTVSIWKLHYECQFGEDLYEIYGHRGRKYSVYKNDTQVAWWDKKAVRWFSGDNYKIIADNDCEIELIICFCLVMDNAKSKNDDGNIVTYDFGNVGFQAKGFNENWEPKD